MKIIIVIGVIIALGVMAFRSPKVDFSKDEVEGIQFYKGSFKEALSIAKKENKIIFLDVYATWCGPCKKLKATTFSDKEVGTMFNQKFINIALDGEQMEGAELAKTYNIKGYPTLLFINSDGKVINKATGYHSPSALIKLGNSIK